MKLILCALNAKYVHTNLAVRYLEKSVSDKCDVHIKEYSINDNIYSIERELCLENPDVIAFSCYIWNIGLILELCSDIKKAMPDLIIVLGGPEVSYDSEKIIKENPFVDYIVRGEGEYTFGELVDYLCKKCFLPDKGVVYRKDSTIVDNGMSDSVEFSDIPFPYDNISDIKGKIIYYESSRGCPYSCKYCLSGENCKVRFKDVEKVKADLDFFDSNNVELVKFVDRTFNADKKRANEIWSHISSLSGKTRFHMEITGELINDETICMLKKVNSDKLQFEIGVQTTNRKTLESISRKCNVDKLFNNIKKLLSETDIHIHLDLIAGLPYEDMDSFEKSFNDVVALKPHVLQLGFLKVLKGSAMENEAAKHGIVYRDKAPYEIISNNYMSYKDILFLKDIDYVFDKFYNSGSFEKTIDYLFGIYDNKFRLFAKIVDYFSENNLFCRSFSKSDLYGIMYDCFVELGSEFEEKLRYDYINSFHPGSMPKWCNTDNKFRFSDEVYTLLKDEEFKKLHLPHYYDVPAKIVVKNVRFERFAHKVLMFDYVSGEVYDFTNFFK